MEFLRRDEQFGARCRALDAHLTPTQHAQGHAIRVLLEERVFWAVPYMRWVTEEGFQAGQRHAFFGPILQAYSAEQMAKFRRSFEFVSKFGLCAWG